MAIILCTLMLAFNAGKIVKIIFVQGAGYREAASRMQLGDTVVPALRGTVYDANMNVLANSSYSWTLCASPNIIRTDETRLDIAKTVSEILEIDYQTVHDQIFDSEDKYEVIKRRLTALQKVELTNFIDEKQYGSILYFEADSLRYYPNGTLASTVLGYIDGDGIGKSGLEASYNEELSGTPGRIITAENANQEAVETDYESIVDAQNGNGIVLTIDSTIQYYLEKAMVQGTADAKATGSYGIVMDVNTGAVLAMASLPDFDPNSAYSIADEAEAKRIESLKGTEEYNDERLNALYTQWRNNSISYCYEPGSAFKVLTLSTALDVNALDETECYTCTGNYRIAGNNIHCVKTTGHGRETLVQGLMNSCNPFFIHIGQKVGREDFYTYFKAFGLTERTGIDLPAEFVPVAGLYYHPEESYSIANLASYSFGQSFKISPIQLITAVSAVANGGYLMQPYVVSEIIDASGSVVKTNQPIQKRQVISQTTAARVRTMMEQVVENGTGKNAYIAGYHVAGKTATSQKLDIADDRLYVASFLCFAPADDPEIAVLIVVDEPRGTYHSGSMVAAPIAREVMEQSLIYLNVEPDYSDKELTQLSSVTPELTGRTVSNAKQYAASKGFSTRVVGDGETVISQMPAADTSIPVKGVIVLYTEKTASKQTVTVPDFKGLSVSEVNSRGVNAGLNIIFSGPSSDAGSTVAYKQSAAPGETVEAGSSVTVYFHSTADTED